MTTAAAEEHNKKLAYSHFGYAGFQLFMLLMMAGFFGFILYAMANAPSSPNGDPPVGFMAVIFAFVTLFQLIFAVPSLIAGFGLLKKKQWAKTASIIAGVLAAMSFPVGTAVTVYTFWFFFSEPGKALYDRPVQETAKRSDWYLKEPSDENSVGNWSSSRKREHTQPREMPNWRD